MFPAINGKSKTMAGSEATNVTSVWLKRERSEENKLKERGVELFIALY